MEAQQTAVWAGHARQWGLVGAPLRPSPEDGALALAFLRPALTASGSRRRLAVLGVTPELVQQPWPLGTDLHAFDHSVPMLETVWQPHPWLASRVTLARWQALPLGDGHFDAVAGDGAFNALSSLDDYGPLFAELARVARPQAALVLRCFVRPETPECLDAVVEAAMGGQVSGFHALKWRLAMALAEDGGGVVKVRHIHEAFCTRFERGALAQRTGWPPAVIDTIEAYRAADTVYTFPTLAQWRAHCEPYWRVDALQHARHYELAERCPTVRFVRCAGPA